MLATLEQLSKMADFFILEHCAISLALDALGFSIGLSLVFLLLHETPFLQSPQLSALVGRVRFHLYLFHIRVCNQTYLSNLFALFPKKRDTQKSFRDPSMTIGKKFSAQHFFVILTGKTFFIIMAILLFKNLDLRCVKSIRLYLRHSLSGLILFVVYLQIHTYSK